MVRVYYAFRPVGMVHGDWEVLEETILFISLSGPVEYIGTHKIL